MARKKKPIEVQKFGGIDELGQTKLDGHKHELSSVETQSQTKLEDDTGNGIPVIIRCFTFGANPEAFKDHTPTKQELFDSHKKGIEMHLWRDGMIYYDYVPPRIVMGKDSYQIFIAALPARGNMLHEKPRTLSELAHGE
jgi:hypothetical protein